MIIQFHGWSSSADHSGPWIILLHVRFLNKSILPQDSISVHRKKKERRHEKNTKKERLRVLSCFHTARRLYERVGRGTRTLALQNHNLAR